MKPRVLIVSDPFTSPAYTPRLRCLCDYLAAEGWTIDLYTERCENLTFEHDYSIHEIAVYHTSSPFEWAVKSFWSLLTDWRNRFFTSKVQEAIVGKEYDLVFCSTFSTFPLRTALTIARERHLPLHVDLRDIDEQAPGAQYQNHRQWWLRPFRKWYRDVNIARRNKVLRQASRLTCVSPWHQAFLSKLNPHTELIYNGFDEQLFYPEDLPTEHFEMAYVGRVYEQQLQDPTMLMQALRKIEIPLRIHWYTSPAGQQRIRLLAEQYDVERFMCYHSYVPTTQVPNLLRSSSVLLVLSNNAAASGAHGIMTTKFFEALGVEKPVLCVPSDEECLAEVIKETNAGLAATNTEEIKEFILAKYQEWKNNGFTHQPVNQAKKRLFSRQYQAQQFEQLLISLLRHD